MPAVLRGISLVVFAAVLCAQTQAPASPQAPAGLETDWEIAAVLQEMSAHAARLLPLLDRADAQSWVNKGASETYVAQLQSCKDQARALVDGTKALARNPEALSAALEVLFRVQGLETMLNSVAEGFSKYQNPAAAQELVALAAENGPNRDRLQRYTVNLAAEREREYEVMDREAQRCRGIISAPATTVKKKN